MENIIPLSDLKKTIVVHPKESTSKIKYLLNKEIDFDIFLPTKNKNLQRPFVWTTFQKQQLIESILLERHIPHLSFLELEDETCQIIDGKQRLTSTFEFVKDKFFIKVSRTDGTIIDLFYSELSEDYKLRIDTFHFRYYIEYENLGANKAFSDQNKIDWFKFINFAGTEVDQKHIQSLL